MDTLEIHNLLKTYKSFKGVYPLDKIPKLRYGIIIVNSDVSSEPGEHWVALSINRSGVSEYFDSFGLFPFSELENYLHSNSLKGWVYNTVNLQNISSDTCGNYCVLYVSLRCRGYKFADFLSLFTHSTLINDKIVRSYIYNLKNGCRKYMLYS